MSIARANCFAPSWRASMHVSSHKHQAHVCRNRAGVTKFVRRSGALWRKQALLRFVSSLSQRHKQEEDWSNLHSRLSKVVGRVGREGGKSARQVRVGNIDISAACRNKMLEVSVCNPFALNQQGQACTIHLLSLAVQSVASHSGIS